MFIPVDSPSDAFHLCFCVSEYQLLADGPSRRVSPSDERVMEEVRDVRLLFTPRTPSDSSNIQTGNESAGHDVHLTLGAPNVAATYGHPPDFTPPISATQSPVSGNMASFDYPQEPWGKHSGPFASSPLYGDVEMKDVIIGGPPTFASPAAGFPSLPGTNPLTTLPARTVAPSFLQSASRRSRSNSLFNPPSGDPFAYGVLVSEATIDECAEYRPRLNTGFSRSHSPISSPDDDDEHDSDTGSPSQLRYRVRHGSMGEANYNFSRQISRRSFVNRTSTVNSTAMGAYRSGSSSHSNEVPQEYRAEVDRIFFEFLNKICSDRVFHALLKHCMR